MTSGRVAVRGCGGGTRPSEAPADLGFVQAMDKVKTNVQLSLARNETSDHVHWHVPEAHYLESWGDARSYECTITIVQTMIQPLNDGKSGLEMLAAFSDSPAINTYEVVIGYW